MIGIYKIENNINHKVYIGQSKNIEFRWKKHCSNMNSAAEWDKPLYRAFRKYGIDNFSFSVVELCEIEDLNQKEKYYIEKYNSFSPNGYNLTLGGESSVPVKLSLEDVVEIKNLLQHSTLSQTEIANRYDVSQITISNINLGITWINNNSNYPLRKERYVDNQPNKLYFCIDCGKQISRGTERCFECRALFQRKTERPSRQELKNLIRTESFVSIGKRYRVTDNAIRKWCKSYNLPSKKSEINLYSDSEWEAI